MVGGHLNISIASARIFAALRADAPSSAEMRPRNGG